MTDIYDIKQMFLWIDIWNILMQLLFIFVLVYLFVEILAFYKSIKNKNLLKTNNRLQEQKIIEQSITDLEKQLFDLQNNMVIMEKELFYAKASDLFKKIYYFIYWVDIIAKTLEEINQSWLSEDLYQKFKQMYINEFDPYIIDDQIQRRQTIKYLTELLKNNKLKYE